MKNILLLVFALCPALSLAQDMVITLKNDTLKGKAKLMVSDKIDRIQIIVGKEKIPFTAVQVKSLTLEQEVYHPVRTLDGYQFMKLITPGFLSLYMGRRVNSMVYDDQYLVKRNGDVMEVPNLTFKKSVGNFLNDCVNMKDRIKDEKMGVGDLNKIITEYNLCIDRQTQATHPPAAVGTEDPKMVALSSLKAKLISGSVSVPKDALDMLDDITDKVRNNKPVPNYLLDGLQDFLKDHPTCQAELGQVMKLLKTP